MAAAEVHATCSTAGPLFSNLDDGGYRASSESVAGAALALHRAGCPCSDLGSAPPQRRSASSLLGAVDQVPSGCSSQGLVSSAQYKPLAGVESGLELVRCGRVIHLHDPRPSSPAQPRGATLDVVSCPCELRQCCVASSLPESPLCLGTRCFGSPFNISPRRYVVLSHLDRGGFANLCLCSPPLGNR